MARLLSSVNLGTHGIKYKILTDLWSFFRAELKGFRLPALMKLDARAAARADTRKSLLQMKPLFLDFLA